MSQDNGLRHWCAEHGIGLYVENGTAHTSNLHKGCREIEFFRSHNCIAFFDDYYLGSKPCMAFGDTRTEAVANLRSMCQGRTIVFKGCVTKHDPPYHHLREEYEEKQVYFNPSSNIENSL